MIYQPGHYYHIFNRGAQKLEIFYEPKNYEYLLSIFQRNMDKYGVTIAAVCLMPNHYHIILSQGEEGSIGRFLRTSFNTYVQGMNKVYRRHGTLFQGQCKVKHIDSDEYLVQVVRYVHRNPVEAGYVDDPKAWQYSNYAEWIGERNGALMDEALLRAYFQTHQQYRRFVEEYRGSDTVNQIMTYTFDKAFER
ncbi:MAG: transposase [Bacteroidetes bacterium]|nr:transposase [Bacteroidota bacterium]